MSAVKDAVRNPFAGAISARRVITSYSIHYTKLYEAEVDVSEAADAGSASSSFSSPGGVFGLVVVAEAALLLVGVDDRDLDRGFSTASAFSSSLGAGFNSGASTEELLSEPDDGGFGSSRITSYNVCYTKLLRF